MSSQSPLFMKEWYVRTEARNLLRAVIVVFERLAGQGEQPSCTYWVANHAYLEEHAMPAVLDEWSAHTGLDRVLFPWHVDEVATTWEEWRKCNLKYRETFLRQLSLHGLADAYAHRQQQKDRETGADG